MDGVSYGADEAARCNMKSSAIMATYSVFFINMLVILLACRLLNFGLRRLGQPRLVSEYIVGFVIGNVGFLNRSLEIHVVRFLHIAGQISVMGYMFVTGIEMDPRALIRRPRREAVIAYTGTVTTLFVALALYPFINRGQLTISSAPRFALFLAITLSNTASPILTRLTTELKIGKSEIGRLVVDAGVHNDMVTTLLICLGSSLQRSQLMVGGRRGGRNIFELLFLSVVVLAEGLLIFKAMPRFVEWINDRNPEGKPMKGSDMALSMLLLLALCYLISSVTSNTTVNAFLVGLFFPKRGRLPNMLISKINFFLTTLGLPLYVCWVGMQTSVEAWSGVIVNEMGVRSEFTAAASLSKLAILSAVGAVGKVSGTVFTAMHYGFPFPEAISLGLLLNVKGHFHIFCTVAAAEKRIINTNSFLVILFVIIGTIVYIPLVVAFIVRRARRRAHRRQMGLQWHDPATELRMVVGIHGPQNIPAAVHVIEATRGRSESPLTVYAMDMIELTDRAAATLVQGQGLDAVTVTDEAIVETRQAISFALESYVHESGEGLTIRRLLAVSSFSNMHQDICNGAEDTMAVIIILPFHKSQRVDGAMDGGHSGFKQVNEKVLQNASCSVGILVDRALGRSNPVSASYASQHVAVIFIGGGDDREALIYAARMAQHPGVHLTAVRFLLDRGTAAAMRARRMRGRVVGLHEEREMQLDDGCFAEFYERHIADGSVGYVEKYAANGAETVAMLRTLEGLYNLFVVGRGEMRNSPLTSGMNDWAECPELGPIGDVLASSDFSVTASALIIQQHSAKRIVDGIDLDFAIG